MAHPNDYPFVVRERETTHPYCEAVTVSAHRTRAEAEAARDAREAGYKQRNYTKSLMLTVEDWTWSDARLEEYYASRED